MYALVTSTKKFFQSVYLRKWTQLCKKDKLKYQVLAQWKGRKPKKKCAYTRPMNMQAAYHRIERSES